MPSRSRRPLVPHQKVTPGMNRSIQAYPTLGKYFNPGFRLSITDVIILIAGAIASLLVANIEFWFGIAIVFTVGHFFLFCNVFRMPRHLELAWAALFLLLLGSTIVMQQPDWLVSFGFSLIGTVVVVVIQLRQPSYHGVGWSRINPQLPQWWQAQDHR